MTRDVYGKKLKYSFKKISSKLDGEFLPKAFQVNISNTLNGDDLARTILHEELHAVLFRLGFNQVLTPEVEELLVELTSNWIVENYRLKPR